MASAEPRRAATVILLRDGPPPQLLMVARNPAVRVMGGVWVFPGGAVEASDGECEDGLRAAALRELAEETGIVGLEARALVPFARWIAPSSLTDRFDTHFFVARAPDGAEPIVDGVEIVEARWLSAAEALDGRLPLLFPTRKQLEALLPFASVEALLAGPPARAFEPVRPRFRRPGDAADPLLPGDAGYETASG